MIQRGIKMNEEDEEDYTPQSTLSLITEIITREELE